MPVFRWGHAWNAFQDLEREVDRLLSSMNFTMQGVRLGRNFPAVNFYDYDDYYLLTAELPGTRREDLELSISEGMLVLKGKRGFPEDIPENAFRRTERFRGSWQRTISLPERIIEDGLKAELNKGILKITLPKAPETTPRKIPIVEGGDE